MNTYIKLIALTCLLLSFFSYGSSSETQCRSTNGTMYSLTNDPGNGKNIVINGETYRFKVQSIIGNKKITTYINDSGTLANVILIVNPKTGSGDIYIVIYLDSAQQRELDIDELNLHCKI
ncbi:hypothetical protein N0S44_000273 [Escherichia coli]|nr:hypothetical protein [Escherichia coli]EJR1979118.1 hypothetical protein [Escherichia coli]